MSNPDPSIAKGPCPFCGQRLSLPTVDLQQSFQCPRCQRALRASDLVAKHLTVSAVPLGSPVPSQVTGSPYPPPSAPMAGGGPYAGPQGGMAPGAAFPVASSWVATLPPSQVPGHAPEGYPPSSARGYPVETPVTAPPSGPGLWTSAFQVGHQGVQLAGDAAGCFGRLCARVDAAIHQRRKVLLLSVAVAAGAAPFVDTFLLGVPWGFHPLTWVGLCGFAFLVVVMVVARLGALRDEHEAWQAGLLVGRAGAWLSSLGEGIGAWLALDATRKLLVLLRGGVVLGVLALSACSAAVVALDMMAWLSRHSALVDAADGAHYEGLLAWAQGLVLVGLGADFVAAFRLQRTLKKPSAQPGVSDALPSLLDCNDQAGMQSLAARAKDPALSGLLTALAAWKPRHHDRERGYQLALLRFLKGRLPEFEPDDEVPLRSPTGKRSLRADLTVGPVLIEMKSALSTSAAQRAVGQVGMYLEAWKQGPLLLLVCDTDPQLQGWLRQEVERLRLQGPVSLVVARTGRR